MSVGLLPDDQLIDTVADTLASAYGLRAVKITRIQAGTATINFHVVDHCADQWFAKVYRDRTLLDRERTAIELAEFARTDGVPVPGVVRTSEGKVIEDGGPLPMSVWQYVSGAETAESGITGGRWRSIGSVLGRLHRRLAEHPAAAPKISSVLGVSDLDQARARFERLIIEYGRQRTLDPFQAWAVDAAKQRVDLLDRVAMILAGLPRLTVQIVHGDLAAPNLLLRGDEVAAMIDFQPPKPRYLSWEIARIACDPRTVLLGDHWLTGLPELLAAYRDEHPTARSEDLGSVVAVGCAYTLASTYPLGEPLDNPSAVTPSLEAYGRARHEAAIVLLRSVESGRAAPNGG